ncbi:DNA translocase FtsK [Clostridium aminobutyricum]|uniref:DNA translocase FtsK n=2 Tax=Clostridium aminobutyricum TaxID=33953 RepID=A0A939D7K7_CLOAM|nr:DNA translocase FtsK [Clostridium aminobutyricum]
MISIIFSARYIEVQKISFAYIDMAGWFQTGIKATNGGCVGMLLSLLVMVAVGKTGLYIFAGVVIIICLMLIINTPISQFFEDFKLKKEIKRQLAEEAAEAEAEELSERQKQMELDLKKAYSEHGKSAANLTVSLNGEDDIGTVANSAKANERKKNILGYMKDDKLFKQGLHELEEKAAEKISEPEVKISYGLEEAKPIPEGFGLTDEPVIPIPVQKTQVDLSGLKIKAFEPEPPIEDQQVMEIVETLAPKPEEDRLESPDGKKNERHEIKPSKQEAAASVLNANEFNVNSQVDAMANYEFPSIELLNKNSSNKHNAALENTLKAKAVKLEETLHNFNVNAKVVQVTQGPAVTRYEIQPNTGVKVSSIVRLADDIALNLEARSIRIEAPIPGKAAVGIEVENEKINMVTVREIIDSKEFKESKSKITFAVGKDIAGKAIVADLKTMPHLLIAGSTGSGKSVCINSIIVSILYKAKPDEVKFVLIDPKVVELGNYNGIPHMLIPVVTEPSKAAAALNWAVAEMTDRYKKFADEGVRDLASFNEAVKEKGETDRFMPQIVIIIDELADLMMAAPSQVEESICRLAQMARAAGMHLIVATQRPSVDIITGVIKANIPSRVAFAVSSQFDSRTILDMAGAEKLVGKGDMLFNPLGSGKPVRVQGNFISDSEVHSVIEHLKKWAPNTEYAHDVIHSIEKANTNEVSDDGDELLSEAIETVVRAEQASVSMLQRRFRIGYNRAARIVDMMEARGIIGPADGSRPRQVLLTLDELLGIREEGQSALEEGVPEEI